MRRTSPRVCAVLLSLLTLPALAAGTEMKSAGDCWLPAFKAGDADAVTACYADDAILWIPGAPAAKGSREIHDMYAGYFDASIIKEVELNEIGSHVDGDTRTAWGTFRMVAVSKADGSEATESGRYTDVQKKIKGHWVYIVDHASDEPSTETAPAEAGQ